MLGRLRRARKERRRRLAEELLSQQGRIPAEPGQGLQKVNAQGPDAHLAVAAAEERVKVAERRLEVRMRQSSAEIEDLVRFGAESRARAEAAERELASARESVRELRRKLSHREHERWSHNSGEAVRRESKPTEIDQSGEGRAEELRCLLDDAQGRLEELARQQEEAERTAELIPAVDAKAEEVQREGQAPSWFVQEAEDRLNEIEARARNSDERAERAERIATLMAEEAAYLRRINEAKVRRSRKPANGLPRKVESAGWSSVTRAE